jgi:hypothetical protein
MVLSHIYNYSMSLSASLKGCVRACVFKVKRLSVPVLRLPPLLVWLATRKCSFTFFTRILQVLLDVVNEVDKRVTDLAGCTNARIHNYQRAAVTVKADGLDKWVPLYCIVFATLQHQCNLNLVSTLTLCSSKS